MKNLILILCLFLATTAFDCGKSESHGAGGDAKDVVQTTAIGVTVVSRGGISAEQLGAINSGVAEVIEDGKALGFTEHLDPHLYTIGIVAACETTPGGNLAWRIPANDYDGTQYDINPAPGIGEVYAAERVLMERAPDFTSRPSNTYQICPGSVGLMQNTARYGLEHILLFWNDFPEYQATANHGSGGGHPLIASRQK